MASRIGTEREGPIAKKIEERTERVPSDAFLWTALGVAGTSLALRIAGQKHAAIWVGQWAPAILILGMYNKLVKIAGHEGERISA